MGVRLFRVFSRLIRLGKAFRARVPGIPTALRDDLSVELPIVGWQKPLSEFLTLPEYMYFEIRGKVALD